MNPKDSPHNSKRQANQNLDDSQSSSVSIKIFNKNDDNVVIRLYRNKTRTNRDKFKNSRGHLRQAAGRSEGKDKRKPTMFRNLYRNTFGPTIDETVLVGMETFQICQQDCQGQSCSAPDNSNDTCVANDANELQEDCRKTGSIIPNELSWDCSTLLPTSTNEKNFESVCTNTSNCMLDKEMNLSPLVTNQYQYSPCLAKSQTETGCPYSPPTQTNGSSEEPNPLNNVSSDENLTFRKKSRRRSGQEKSFSIARTPPQPIKKTKAIPKCPRESSGSDGPRPSLNEDQYNQEYGRVSTFTSRNSEAAPRNSRRSSFRPPPCSHGQFAEGCVATTEENPNLCNCSPALSEREGNLSSSIAEYRRRSSKGPQIEPELSKRCTFYENLPHNSQFREQSISSQPFEDSPRYSYVSRDFEEDPRRYSAQPQSFIQGPNEEPPRRMSNKIADYFRKNTRKTTPRVSIQLDKQLDRFTRADINEEMPRGSAFPTDPYDTGPQNRRRTSTPRRSSMPRGSFIEADEEYIQEAEHQNRRRTSTPRRSSMPRESFIEADEEYTQEVEHQSRRRSSSPRRSSMPRESFIEADDEYTQEAEHQNRRRSSSPRRSSMPRESFKSDHENTQVDNLRRPCEGRESKGLFNKFKRKISQSTPRQSASIQTDYIRTGSYMEEPMESARSYESEHQNYRRSSTPGRSSRPCEYFNDEEDQPKCRRKYITPRKSFHEDMSGDDLPQEETFRRSSVASMRRKSQDEQRKSERRYSTPRKSFNEGDDQLQQEAFPRTPIHKECPGCLDEQPESGRKYSTSRKSFHEGDDRPQEEDFPRASIGSEGRESLEETIEIEVQDIPRMSTASPDTQPEGARRRSTTRPTLTRKSFNEDYVPEREDNSRGSTLLAIERERRSFMYDKPMVSTFSPECQGYADDYPTYPNQRKSRQFSASAQSEESRLRRCRCEIEQISRNNIPQETRYAITRVTKYDDYTTYEILKSTRAKPKKIPEILEKIFIEKDI